MTSISKLAIKNLNDRILTQNIIMQTLMDIILENGLVTEKELESRIQKNIEGMERTLIQLRQDSSEDSRIGEEELNGLYFGPVGEA